MKALSLPVIPETPAKIAPLVSRPSTAISNPDWILCSELSEQYWVVLSRFDFPRQKYCQAYSVYTSFIWDDINHKEIGAIESFKYRPAVENYYERIRVALELFVM
jgi:phage terminase small subunit